MRAIGVYRRIGKAHMNGKGIKLSHQDCSLISRDEDFQRREMRWAHAKGKTDMARYDTFCRITMAAQEGKNIRLDFGEINLLMDDWYINRKTIKQA